MTTQTQPLRNLTAILWANARNDAVVVPPHVVNHPALADIIREVEDHERHRRASLAVVVEETLQRLQDSMIRKISCMQNDRDRTAQRVQDDLVQAIVAFRNAELHDCSPDTLVETLEHVSQCIQENDDLQQRYAQFEKDLLRDADCRAKSIHTVYAKRELETDEQVERLFAGLRSDHPVPTENGEV